MKRVIIWLVLIFGLVICCLSVAEARENNPYGRINDHQRRREQYRYEDRMDRIIDAMGRCYKHHRLNCPDCR